MFPDHPADDLHMARGAYSSVLSQARGRVGEQVYVKTRSGLAIKSRPRYRQFPNPATAGARERMIQAKDAWLGLDVEQVRAWRAFAKQIHRVNPVDGTEYSPIAYNAFIMLATRFLQANPMGEIPVWPPEEEFAGDEVVLKVNKASPTAVQFLASGPNSPDVVTEILVQKLPNIRRSPTKFYKATAIRQFLTGQLNFNLELPAGVYVFAYRFIQATTGLCTGLWTWDEVVVLD